MRHIYYTISPIVNKRSLYINPVYSISGVTMTKNAESVDANVSHHMTSLSMVPSTS